MFSFAGNEEAISFTDGSSPDTRATGTKVCIEAQVNRDLSLDWYYRVIQLFPDVQGELKSNEVAERFHNFPPETRTAIWRGLRRVRIHIVDPRPHQHRLNNILRKIWKNIQAPNLLAQALREDSSQAKQIAATMRDMVADSILRDSTAVRVQHLARAYKDPFGANEIDDTVKHYFARRDSASRRFISTNEFRHPKSLIHDTASWSAKSSAAFHSVLDTEMDCGEERFADGSFVRRKMAKELLSVHAFDEGNQRHLDLLEQKRRELLEELEEPDYFYGLRPELRGIVPAESRQSFYVQAADIAAGIASHIFVSGGLIDVIERFEYVTYNGLRISRADAEEEMRMLRVTDLTSIT